jgi:TonB family protein
VRCARDVGEPRRVVTSVPRDEPDAVAFLVREHPVAVVFFLEDPALACERLAHERGVHQRDGRESVADHGLALYHQRPVAHGTSQTGHAGRTMNRNLWTLVFSLGVVLGFAITCAAEEPMRPATDFRFTSYVKTVHAMIKDKWAGRALPGQQPVVRFDINRDGSISSLAVKKSSGNPYYDQAALRAIAEAAPFPPLPPEYDGPTLETEVRLSFRER